MHQRRGGSAILWYQAIPLALGVSLPWLNELWGLPARLFGGEHVGDWREAVLETSLALLVGVPMMLLTRRLVARLYYLEGHLRLCAWCRKVGQGGEWVPLGQFFKEGFDTRTTHGMCPECHTKVMQDVQRIGGPPSPGGPSAVA